MSEEIKPIVITDKSERIRDVNITHYVAITLWIGWLLTLPILIGILVFSFFYGYLIVFTLLLGAFLVTSLYPIDRKKQPKWGYALGDWIMLKASEYFGLKVIMLDKAAIEKKVPAVVVLEPHDVLPVSVFAYSGCLGFFKGHSFAGCVTSICFQVPFMKHVYTWAAATSVDKKNLQKLLSSGQSPVVCPGGAQEVIYLESHDEYNLFLRKRFGLVKLAMQYGVPIIPSFTFGQRATYDFWVPKNKFIHSIGRKIGFIPMVFFGAFGLPFGPPKSKQLTLVIGKPIEVPKIDDPNQDQLESYQGKLILAFEDIFERFKGEHGMTHVKLNII